MSKIYAQITAGLCTGITQAAGAIVAPDMIEIASYDERLLGQAYSGGKFTPAPPRPASQRLSKLAYMNQFSDAELEAIYTAAKSVVSVEIWLEKFKATTPDADGTAIDLDDPRTVAGLQGMEAAGLIGAGRAAAILSGVK